MSAGNSDGNCTDCGEPIWWSGSDGNQRLVTQGGNRWCFGRDESHVGMTHWHALPGMAQFIVKSPNGQVCHCLDRHDPHIHQITDVPAEGSISDQTALDQIAGILRLHVGNGQLLGVARLVKRTGRNTGWNLP
jgi:hypothetical protein